jgi:hypothetical protein
MRRYKHKTLIAAAKRELKKGRHLYCHLTRDPRDGFYFSSNKDYSGKVFARHARTGTWRSFSTAYFRAELIRVEF